MPLFHLKSSAFRASPILGATLGAVQPRHLTDPFRWGHIAFILTELLVNAVLDRMGDAAVVRMRAWEQAAQDEVFE